MVEKLPFENLLHSTTLKIGNLGFVRASHTYKPVFSDPKLRRHISVMSHSRGSAVRYTKNVQSCHQSKRELL